LECLACKVLAGKLLVQRFLETDQIKSRSRCMVAPHPTLSPQKSGERE
jgi:hypothetical protein